MRQKGFSLVEMMVTLALGLIIMGAAMGVYIGVFAGNSSQMKMARLNGDLRIAMMQVTRDMRRAAYHNWTLAELTVAEPDFLSSPQAWPDIAVDTAVIRYDENANGVADAAEVFSFRHHDSDGDGSGDTIQERIGAGVWSNLTDPAVIRITEFAIADHSPGAVNPPGALAAVTVPVYTVAIAGELVGDASVSRSMRETVRIRNPVVVANP